MESRIDRGRPEERRTQDRHCAGLRRLGALSLAAFVAMGIGFGHPVQEQDEEFEPYAFHLYNTQAARARAEKAADHVAAGRWSEALAELQGLIEEHRGEVLGAARPQPDGARNPSQADVHAGAGAWAAAQLFAMPEAGRRLYRERFGPRADQAFERATASADRGALGRVAQRWPLTEAAERAWWALGDLELELGHVGDGLRAWARAGALHVGQPDRHTAQPGEWRALRDLIVEGEGAAGAVARIDYALAALSSDEVGDGLETAPEDQASFASGPAAGIAADSLSSRSLSRDSAGDVGGWPSPHVLPRGPYSDVSGASRLFPQRLGDTVFINTSRSVHALDAFDGRERWSFQSERLEWDRMSARRLSDYEEAVDKSERIVTVAASRGVVVAPVQIPWEFERSDQFNDLSIIEVIPERRLVALDAATGAMLWNTMPPEGWSGDTGTFAERMTVVGPPAIVGARVLVPMAQLRGRIELHLGCFDLQSGDVLWSAPLVTGQRTLNMFGRSNIEFSAPPPVVSGDTVVMQTQLGIIAAVDLFTGDTRWDTVYEQVPIRAPQYYAAGWIDNRWRNAPPIVHDGTVLAAPFDGDSLMALDLESGAMLWSIDQAQLSARARVQMSQTRRGPEGGLNVLLAADDHHVILGGSKLASIEFSRGLRGGPPYSRAWAWPLENALSQLAGHPTVDSTKIFVPDGDRIATIDRASGRVLEDVGSTLGRGNLLVSRGMLFSTDGAVVEARFQWRAMVDRARAVTRSGKATARDVATLARLLLERAETLLALGQNMDNAVSLTDEAAEAIEAHIARSDPESTLGGRSLEPVHHRAMMLRAHAMRLRGDASAARAAIARALTIDAGPERELEALLLAHEIERYREPSDRLPWLERILRDHPNALIEVTTELRPGRWSAFQTLSSVLEVAREADERGPRASAPSDPWTDPWAGALTPTMTSLDPPVSDAIAAASGRTRAGLSAGLFARLNQVEIGRTLPGREASLAAELDALHSVLRDAPEASLFGVVSSELWATARIQALRALHPRAKALERYEDAADRLFDMGLSQARSSGTTSILESIPDLFPGSDAARRAAESRVEFALENGSAKDVAGIVVGALDPDWHPARSTDRQTNLLVRLAHTLAEAGNPELRAGLLENLARYQPDAVVLTETGATQKLSELSATMTQDLVRASGDRLAASRVAFGRDITVQMSGRGDYLHVASGTLEREGEAPRAIAFFASRNELIAVPSGSSGAPLWRRDASFTLRTAARPEQVAVSGSHLIVAERSGITCLDVATGQPEWSFAREGRLIGRVFTSGGMVVACTDLSATGEPAEVHGIEVAGGIELWRLGAISGLYHPELKVAEGRVLLLPERGKEAAVHDLYTGHGLTAIKTGPIGGQSAGAAWIHDGRLVVPFIEASRSRTKPNAIVAFELDDGRQAWTVDLDRHAGGLQSLLGIVEMPVSRDSNELVRLALLQRDGAGSSSGGSNPPMGIHVLNERLGALDQRPLATVADNARLMGVTTRRRVVLNSPLLICLEQGRAGAAPTFRAIDPQYGELWRARAVRRLRVAAADKHGPPALGEGVIAVMVAEEFGDARGGASGVEMKLMLLDSASGAHIETRPLETGPTPSGWRGLVPFGGALAVTGSKEMKVFEGAPR